MGVRSTITGYWRARGNSGNTSRTGPTPAVLTATLGITNLDATADAGTLTGKFLPRGAIPLSVSVFESTTIAGGTSPILDIGLELGTPDDNGLADGLDYEVSSNTQVGATLAGVLLGSILAEDVEVTYGDDGVGTNNTSGEIDIFITYSIDDDGALAS
jgi:hypothetical protein